MCVNFLKMVSLNPTIKKKQQNKDYVGYVSLSFKRCVARYIQTVYEYSSLHFSHIRRNFSPSSLQSDAFFRVNASASGRDDDKNVSEQHQRLFMWEKKLKNGMCPKMTTEKEHKTKQNTPEMKIPITSACTKNSYHSTCIKEVSDEYETNEIPNKLFSLKFSIQLAFLSYPFETAFKFQHKKFAFLKS